MKKDISEELNIVILMAGNGTRMKSFTPKPFIKIGGLQLFLHILNTMKNIDYKTNIIEVISKFEENEINKIHKNEYNVNYTIQENKCGTGHATLCALKSKFWKSENKYTGIFYGDVPFVSEKTIKKMVALQKNYDLVVLGFIAKDQEKQYGRLFLKEDLLIGQWGRLDEIKEFKDLPREKPKFCNSGIYFGKTEIFEKLLPQIKNDNNKQKEYYLTDIVKIANENNLKVGTYICEELEVVGVNTKIELEEAEQILQQKLKNNFMLNGTTMINAKSIYVSYDTKIGKDVIIEPNVFIGTNVVIGNNCTIKAGSYLENVNVPDNTIVRANSVLIVEK